MRFPVTFSQRFVNNPGSSSEQHRYLHLFLCCVPVIGSRTYIKSSKPHFGIGNATFKLLANLVAPQKPGELSYNKICEQLEKHFSPKPVKIAKRFRFHNRQQQSGETVADYLANLQKLVIHCKFGEFLEEACAID